MRRFVKELADGEALDEIFLVTDKQLRANRNGNLYLQVDLADRTGTINARQWNAGEAVFKSFDVGDFLQVRGKVQLFQGSLQVILNQVERVRPEKVGLDLGDFLPCTPHDIDDLLRRLRGILLKLTNAHLRALVECFLMDADFVHDFCRAPAGIKNHHAYLGGLLEHVVTLLDGAERLLPLYPHLDPDLLLMGIFLHDIGKVRELTYGRSFGYSDQGQLIGHLVIGVEILSEKAARVPELTGEPFPTELLLRLKHMIVAHHGTYEFGSPKLPMTPEAIALHYLDNFDAKVHSFTRDIREDRNAVSAWTPFNPQTQRKLFKGTVEGGDSYTPTQESSD
jgi:3'-5' exoribonuclease